MTKLIDIAQKAGVSKATVSLALNNSKLVNIKTKEKVKLWAKKLNYYPHIAAQTLARGRSYRICLLLNEEYFSKISNLYYLHVIGGIIKKAETENYTIKFSFYEEGSKKENLNIQKIVLDSKNIDGIIVFDVINKNILDIVRKKAKVPLLLVDNHKSIPDIFSVDNDDFGGAYKATRYLISLGHSRIGYVGIPDTHPLGRECWNGFKKALGEKDLNEVFKFKKCNLSIRSGGKKAIAELFDSSKILPTAFFCVNDFIAIEVIDELKRRGFEIPTNFSVIGMDNLDISSEIEPPLTTINIETESIGQIAIGKLISIINNTYSGPVNTVVDNKIIRRKTCKSIDKKCDGKFT